MCLTKNHFVLIFILFTSFIFSQEKENSIPVSIYTNNAEFVDLNSTYNINKKLNLTSFKFLFLNVRDIEEGYYTIPFYHNNNSPSIYIYDTYNKVYQTAELQKSFFKVADLYKPRSKEQF